MAKNESLPKGSGITLIELEVVATAILRLGSFAKEALIMEL